MTNSEKEIKRLSIELEFEKENFESKYYDTIGNGGTLISRPYGGRVVNANTIASDLKRVAQLSQVVRAFAKQLLVLNVFSTAFYNVALEGTDEVTVPYYALDASTSTDFVAANGYDTFGNTSTSDKKVTVNKRKYQGLEVDSSTVRRQPAFSSTNLMELKGQTLAKDVWLDICSSITSANFGAASFTGLASTFDSDDIADLRAVANTAQWPSKPRSLVVTDDYDKNLLKDSAIQNSSAFGSSGAIREGQIPNIFGFDYYHNTNIPGNSENLVGFICHPSAILIAFSPIRPDESIPCRYEIITDVETGISLEFRAWGDPDKDKSRQIIEANYGFVLGEAAALKRMVSA